MLNEDTVVCYDSGEGELALPSEKLVELVKRISLTQQGTLQVTVDIYGDNGWQLTVIRARTKCIIIYNVWPINYESEKV